MPDKYGAGDDPYTYKNSTVLLNKPGITDAAILASAEQEFTALAAAELSFMPPPYHFDYFCNIHKALFSDLFEWAGEIRTIDISKGNTRFCTSRFIEKEAARIFRQLEKDDYLQGINRQNFVKKLAEYYCDINVLHPFREGNGRAQRILFEHLCIHNGYNLNLSGISVDGWINANILGYNGDYSAMEAIFDRCLVAIPA